MIKFADIDDVKNLLEYWRGDKPSLEHLGNSASAVFKFINTEGNWQILRVTDSSFRTREDILAEIAFVNHLKNNQISVGEPLKNKEGDWLMEMTTDRGVFNATSFRFANGTLILKESIHWNVQFAKNWGKYLAQLHQVSKTYGVKKETPKLFDWQEEIIIKHALELLPVDDDLSKTIFTELVEHCKHLEKTKENYGVIHADLSYQNFHYDLDNHSITAFDFGNACYNWYMADVAISLITMPKTEGQSDFINAFLEGYNQVIALEKDYENQIRLFTRLRYMYVYLDRLYTFGKSPTFEQQVILKSLASKVHQKIEK
jgi:amicoumacin kinase